MTAISEKIIEQVKLYPVLYDLSNPEYKNLKKKNKIWDKIGKSLEAEGEDVKKKWKNLRDAYAKHLRAEKINTGQKPKSVDRYKSWPWAQSMTYFRPFLELSQAEKNSNLINSPQPADDASDAEEQTKKDAIEASHKANLLKKPRYEDKPKSSVNAVLTYLQDKPTDSLHLDEIDLLFMGYAKTVKKFSTRRQIMVKFQFAKILMEAELEQQVEEENVTISLPESQFTHSIFNSLSSSS